LSSQDTVVEVACKTWDDAESATLHNASGGYVIDQSGHRYDLTRDLGDYSFFKGERTIVGGEIYKWSLVFARIGTDATALKLKHPQFREVRVQVLTNVAMTALSNGSSATEAQSSSGEVQKATSAPGVGDAPGTAPSIQPDREGNPLAPVGTVAAGGSETETGSVRRGASAHEEESPPGTAKQVQDFVWTLDACRLEADHVLCTLSVVNRIGDRDLEILGQDSRIVDSKGYEHYPAKVTLGSRECVARNAKVTAFCMVRNLMPTDVPVALTIGFEGVPPDSSAISFMEIALHQNGRVPFHGIPLKR